MIVCSCNVLTDTARRVWKNCLYTLDANNQPQPMDVKIGLSNFRYTEVVGGALKKGDKVVTRAIVENKDGVR